MSNTVRDEIAAIFEVYIPKGQWRVLLDALDQEGKPTRKQVNSILLSFGQHIEALEDQVAELQTQLLPKTSADVNTTYSYTRTTMPEALMTAQTIIQELQAKNPLDKAYYLGVVSWDILVAQIKKEGKKLNPELFYGKEVDPKTGHEKTCIFANALGTTPIFRA